MSYKDHLSLEEQFGKYFGETKIFAYWKGRVALFAALRGLDVGSGDSVMMPGYTCVVVPAAVK
ncbi:MAG: DegT/DnrJ/EryC1/StrS family aminotransferase, partial [Candidatus Kariarchaeaceae archaeon]